MIQAVQVSIGFSSNIYLVSGPTAAVLVDAGSGTDPQVPGRIAALLGDRELKAVLLTHCHADHTGGVPAVVQRFQCPVYIGVRDLPPLRDGNQQVVSPIGLGSFPPLSGLRPIQEGDCWDIGDHVLEAIDTPGHTAGSVSFWDRRTGSLFSGDTVFWHGCGRCDLPTGSNEDMRESLVKLSNVNITALYPGHDEATADGAGSVAMAQQMMDGL